MRVTAKIIIISFLIYTTACLKEDRSDVDYQANTVQINEVLRITSEINEISDFDKVFTTPGRTVSNSEGVIYTVDPLQSIIYKFDNNGHIVNTLGGEGRGPGEFQSVYAMAIIDDEKLFAYDYVSKRAIIFRSNGEIDETISMEYSRALSQIRPMDATSLLVSMYQDGYFIHIYDLEQQNITESLVYSGDIFNSEQKYGSILLESLTGSAIALTDKLIAYTPEYYEGIIYIYERTENEWRLKESVKGYQNIVKPFSIHETTSEPHENSYLISMHPDGPGFLGFELHSRSLGLYSLKNGRFAHVSLRDADEEKEKSNFVLEIFDYNQNELQKFGVIEELTTGYPPDIRIEWVDELGNLYVTDRSDEPALRKLEVLWK